MITRTANSLIRALQKVKFGFLRFKFGKPEFKVGWLYGLSPGCCARTSRLSLPKPKTYKNTVLPALYCVLRSPRNTLSAHSERSLRSRKRSSLRSQHNSVGCSLRSHTTTHNSRKRKINSVLPSVAHTATHKSRKRKTKNKFGVPFGRTRQHTKAENKK